MHKIVAKYTVAVVVSGLLLGGTAFSDGLEETNKALVAKIGSLTNEYENVKKMHTLLVEKVKKLQSERVVLKTDLEALQIKVADKEKSVGRMSMELKEARDKLAEINSVEQAAPEAPEEAAGENLESELARKNRELVVIKSQKGKVITELRAAEAMLSAEEEKIKRHDTEVQTLVSELSKKEKDWIEKADRLEKKEALSLAKIEKLQKTLSDTRAKLETVRGELKEEKSVKKGLEKYEAENARLKERLAGHVDENKKLSRLESELKSAKLKYSALLSERDKIAKDIESFADDKKKLEEKMDTAFTKLHSEEKALEGELKELKTAYTAKDNEIAVMNEGRKSDAEKMNALYSEIGRLKAEVEKRDVREDAISILKDRVEEMENQDAEVNKLMSEMKSNYGEKEKEVERRRDEVARLKESAKLDDAKTERLAKAKRELESKLREERSDRKRLEKKLDKASSASEESKKALASAVEIARLSKGEMKAAQDALKETTSASEKEYSKLASEKEKLAKQVVSKGKELKALEEKFKKRDVKAEIKKEKLTLKKRNKSLSEKIKSLKGELKETRTGLKNKVSGLRDENRELKAETTEAYHARSASEREKMISEEKLRRVDEVANKEKLDVHYNLAVVYDKNGMYEDAKREYEKCLEINQLDAGVHYNLGILYDDKLNDNREAVKHYTRFLELRPKGADSIHVRQWILNLEQEMRIGAELR